MFSETRLSRPSLTALAYARGFTLHEMLITLVIAGVLSLASVGVYGMLDENEKTVAANELVAHLNLARSEAVTRRVHVRMCPSRDQATCRKADADYAHWEDGWLIYVDRDDDGEPEPSEILQVHPSVGRDFIIRTSRARDEITFQPTGTSGGSPVTFAVCDTDSGDSARYVTVSNTGRARISHATTSNVRCG